MRPLNGPTERLFSLPARPSRCTTTRARNTGPDRVTTCEYLIVPAVQWLTASARYVFPGIGLGGVLAKARYVLPSMVEAASLALAESLTKEERDIGLIYPRLTRVREVSVEIAARVIHVAQEEVWNVFTCNMPND